MNVKLELMCECGNCRLYNVANKYHSESHETYVNLTENIYDEQFKAKPTPSGMWVQCQECKKGYEIV